jgi:hypothetical protein
MGIILILRTNVFFFYDIANSSIYNTLSSWVLQNPVKELYHSHTGKSERTRNFPVKKPLHIRYNFIPPNHHLPDYKEGWKITA